MNILFGFGAIIDAKGHGFRIGTNIIDRHGDEIFDGGISWQGLFKGVLEDDK